MSAVSNLANGSSAAGRGLEAARHAMVVSQLRPNAVTDARLVTAMAETERERFLPTEQGAMAYRDAALPLGNGRAQNAPLATARLLNEARLGPRDKVLLIGAAGGYTAALLSRLVAKVVAVESSPSLAALARAALSGFGNVTLFEGPLEGGQAGEAFYDAIVIDGAVERVPDAVVEQLRTGGRLTTGVLDHGVARLSTGVRIGSGFALEPFADIDCVPLPGFERPRGFQFPG